MTGGCVLAPSFDVAGWFARDLPLFAKVGDVLLTGGRTWPEFNRVLVAEDAVALMDPGIKDALQPMRDRITRARPRASANARR